MSVAQPTKTQRQVIYKHFFDTYGERVYHHKVFLQGFFQTVLDNPEETKP